MRTDDDGWDIVTSVGAAALGVAAMRVVANQRPDALVRDLFAEGPVRVPDLAAEELTNHTLMTVIRGDSTP